jgi:hypothetical protein
MPLPLLVLQHISDVKPVTVLAIIAVALQLLSQAE